MNIEKQFQGIAKSQFSVPDGDAFLEKLHGERQKRQQRKMGFIHGVTSAAIVVVLGMITLSQLTDDPMVYASTDLIPVETMDAETEEFVYDLAVYLVDNSDDIWETLAFLDEIEFEPVVTMHQEETE
jgi:hypothetical protein